VPPEALRRHQTEIPFFMPLRNWAQREMRKNDQSTHDVPRSIGSNYCHEKKQPARIIKRTDDEDVIWLDISILSRFSGGYTDVITVDTCTRNHSTTWNRVSCGSWRQRIAFLSRLNHENTFGNCKEAAMSKWANVSSLRHRRMKTEFGEPRVEISPNHRFTILNHLPSFPYDS
jgi:hypothetical protein